MKEKSFLEQYYEENFAIFKSKTIQELIDAFIHDKDIHTEVASDIFEVEPEEVTKQMRKAAKAVVFGIVYGISGFGLGENLQIKPKDAKPLMAKSTKEGKVLKFARYFGKDYANTIGHAYGYTINKRDIFNRTVNLINAVKKDPTISDGRRIIMDLWQEDDIKDAVLKPCVFCSIWNVLDGKLNAKVVQRSCDVPLGLPFNVTQYSFLLYLLAKITGLEPGKINYSIEDAHIYVNQIEGIKEQLQRQEEIEKGLREDLKAPELILD